MIVEPQECRVRVGIYKFDDLMHHQSRLSQTTCSKLQSKWHTCPKAKPHSASASAFQSSL